ncbi:helix-turn-helix domain-containing protein [Aeribacillus composti]|uniref:helix-turn-helix domain-containing protein n=1 Tax=Aeribacillus composti TaxID=1868734 RepID=UPI002E1F4C5C|nr:helix-turn-helix domain-containing protein [Aeribacillus composti]
MKNQFSYDLVKKYQSFESVEEMDKHVRAFLYHNKSKLSESTVNVLKTLYTHSVKIIGVSFAKYDYIAEKANISRRTVIRAMNKLEEMGIIKRIPTSRPNGKRGVNIIVIQKIDLTIPSEDMPNNNMSPQLVTADVTTENKKNQDNSVMKNNNKRKNVQTDNQQETIESINNKELDATFVPSNVPKSFVDTVKPFFNSAKQIYNLFQRVQIAYEKCKFDRPLDELIDIAVESFKATIFAKKMEKIKKTFEGYFYTVLYSNFVVEKRRENRHLLYDFLNDEI